MIITSSRNINKLKQGDAGQIKAAGVDLTTVQSFFLGVPKPNAQLVIDRATLVSRSVLGLTAGATLNIQKVSKVASPQASYSTAFGGNADLTFTAVQRGTGGTNITIAYVNPNADNAALGVVVAENAITVNLATGGGGAITSTGATVLAALQASAAALALITPTLKTGSSGAGTVQAFAAAPLVGGANYAVFTSALGTANTNTTFTAVTPGLPGEQVSLTVATPATPSSLLTVAVDGNSINVSLATTAGTKQVATSTVVAAAGVTVPGGDGAESGTLPVTVTGAALPNGPIDVQVPLTTALATAAEIATAIVAALNASAPAGYDSPSEAYVFTANGANVVATAITAAANDATLKITWPATNGISAVAASTATTAGVAPTANSTAAQVIAAVNGNAAAAALVTAANATGSNGSGTFGPIAPVNLTLPWTVLGVLSASAELANADFIDNVQALVLTAGSEFVDSLDGEGLLVNITGGSTATEDLKDLLIDFHVE